MVRFRAPSRLIRYAVTPGLAFVLWTVTSHAWNDRYESAEHFPKVLNSGKDGHTQDLPRLTVQSTDSRGSRPVRTFRACSSRQFGPDSVVCVCNSTYCDDLPPVTADDVPVGSYISYISSRSGFRFMEERGQFNQAKNGYEKTDPDVVYILDETGSFQSIIGFGGAFTDSAALNILNLSRDTQDNLLRSYFSSSGSQYTVGRVPIAGSDFSTHVYSYDDVEGDFQLEKFSLTTEDIEMKIPLIRRAGEIAGQKLRIFGSPWSAPAWMKSNGAAHGYGTLKGAAGNQYHKTWAEYFVKFVQNYEAHNVTIWGITTQNEPIDGYIPGFPFNCMGFTATSQRDFIVQDLGPALQKAGLRRVKVLILDDQRFLLPGWADTVLAEADRFVDGIAVHWYADGFFGPAVLTETHARHPGKFLLSTEACEGSFPFSLTPVILGEWRRAETYAFDIIENLQNWVSGWIDWNLALDETGGPNWVHNLVDSPIIVNATADEFYKQPMYYAVAHFSKFMPPESVMVKGHQLMASSWWGRLMRKLTMQEVKRLDIVAAQRPDGGIVVVVLNRGQEDVNLRLVDGRLKRGSFRVWIMARSIQTFVWW